MVEKDGNKNSFFEEFIISLSRGRKCVYMHYDKNYYFSLALDDMTEERKKIRCCVG